ncbi:hypothetical protein BaRGS_00002693 [Batillaria attramentaria]|uniref:CCZ1/INTU/HSP4 first Longin domain-containing protein n=1 Tax=Batillaria attramentaria TaxID=370345 RepID=A0ABD0M387_9CAEN
MGDRPLYRDGHHRVFFLYDHKKHKEEDDPKDAILYFYPPSVDTGEQIALVGGLVGMIDFCSEVLCDTPMLMSLTNTKFAILKTGAFILGLSDDMMTPSHVVTEQLQFLWNTFCLFQGSLDAVKQRSGVDGFHRELNHIWNSYFSLCESFSDELSQAFCIIPYRELSVTLSSVFIHASHILQRAQCQAGVLGGVVLNKNRILCTQLDSDVTRRLLVLMPQEQNFPCKEIKPGFDLPAGVRLLCVYLFPEELESLGPRKKLKKTVQKQGDQDSNNTLNNGSRANHKSKTENGSTGPNYPKLSLSVTEDTSDTFCDTVDELVTEKSAVTDTSASAPQSADAQSSHSEPGAEANRSENVEDVSLAPGSESLSASTSLVPTDTYSPGTKNEGAGVVHGSSSPQLSVTEKDGTETVSAKVSLDLVRGTAEENIVSQTNGAASSKGDGVSETIGAACNESDALSENMSVESDDAVEAVCDDSGVSVQAICNDKDVPVDHGEVRASPSLAGDTSTAEDGGSACISSLQKVDVSEETTHDEEAVDGNSHVTDSDNSKIMKGSDKIICADVKSADSDSACRENTALVTNGPLSSGDDDIEGLQGMDTRRRKNKIIPNPLVLSKGAAQSESDLTVSDNTCDVTRTLHIVETGKDDSAVQHSTEGSQTEASFSTAEDGSADTGVNLDGSATASAVSLCDERTPPSAAADGTSVVHFGSRPSTLTGQESEITAASSSEADVSLLDDGRDGASSVLTISDDLLSPGKERLSFEAILQQASESSGSSGLNQVPKYSTEPSSSDIALSSESHFTPGFSVTVSSDSAGRSQEVNSRSTTKDEAEKVQDYGGRKPALLYVQGHMDTLMVLVMDDVEHAKRNTMNALWRSSLANLAELDYAVGDVNGMDTEDRKDSHYLYLRYNTSSQSVEGTAVQPVTSLANDLVLSSILMHDSFRSKPALQDIMCRTHTTCCYGHKTVSSETFFQVASSRNGGFPDSSDIAFSLDQVADRRLYSDHNAALL